MLWPLVFLSMAPIVVFAVARPLVGDRQALLAATGVAAIEAALDSALLGFVEPFSILSFLLFAGLSWLSARDGDLRAFQLQPVVLECLLAGVFFYFTFVLDRPLFAILLEDYVGLIDWVAPWQRGYFQGYALTMSKSIPFLLLAHAALTAWAARRLTFGGWLLVRIPGFYLMLTILFYAERLLQVPY